MTTHTLTYTDPATLAQVAQTFTSLAEAMTWQLQLSAKGIDSHLTSRNY